MITVASRLGCRICIGRLAMQPMSSGPYVYHNARVPSAVLRMVLSVLSRV